MKKIFVLLTTMLLLNGCAESVALLGTSVSGASNGKILQSSLNSAISYGVKNQTGKYPIEHLLKREKNKIVKKIDLIEKEVVEKSIYAKNTLIDKKDATKKKWVLHLKEIKNVKNKEAFPANKPRYSYWSKAK